MMQPGAPQGWGGAEVPAQVYGDSYAAHGYHDSDYTYGPQTFTEPTDTHPPIYLPPELHESEAGRLGSAAQSALIVGMYLVVGPLLAIGLALAVGRVADQRWWIFAILGSPLAIVAPINIGMYFFLPWVMCRGRYQEYWHHQVEFKQDPLTFGQWRKYKWSHNKKHTAVCVWTVVVSLIISYPLAFTSSRLMLAKRLGSERFSAIADCHANPKPQNGEDNWDEEVEFITWTSHFYIDRDALEVYDHKRNRYCVAPIRLATGNDPALLACRGYRALAGCQERIGSRGRLVDGKKTCSEEALRECGWDKPSESVSSRVYSGLRHMLYSERSDAKFREAADKVDRTLMMHGSTNDPPIVEWESETAGGHFREKEGGLRKGLWVQIIVYPIVWLIGCLVIVNMDMIVAVIFRLTTGSWPPGMES